MKRKKNTHTQQNYFTARQKENTHNKPKKTPTNTIIIPPPCSPPTYATKPKTTNKLAKNEKTPTKLIFAIIKKYATKTDKTIKVRHYSSEKTKIRAEATGTRQTRLE